MMKKIMIEAVNDEKGYMMEIYSSEEREQMLVKMRAISQGFYAQAIRVGNHPFIEFCGLMNEYILLCEKAHKRGIDFTTCNRHMGQPLPMPAYSIRYINEKLECIFQGTAVMHGKSNFQRRRERETR